MMYVFILTHIILGALGALAYAPLNFWPLIFVSMGGFTAIFIHKATSLRHAWIFAFAYFLSYYAVGMGWVAQSFFTVGLGAFSPIAYIGLPLALSIFPVSGCIIAFYSMRAFKPGLHSLILALMLSLAFLIQFLGPFACPWLIPGYAMPLEILQSTAWIGIEGLTVLITLMACLCASRAIRVIIPSIVILGSMYFGGAQRMASHQTHNTPIMVRVVQPCIPQILKWDARKIQDNLYAHAYLSEEDATTPLHAVIWPEAAVVFDFTRDADLCSMFGHVAPKKGYLITGSVTEHLIGHHTKAPRNSFIALNDTGAIAGRCDKQHLLPFGEYVPGRKYLPWISKMTPGTADMTPGEGPRILTLPGLPPCRPLICYEALFSREIWYASDVEPRPQWLLNLTNDAWFGDTFGPYQHLKHVSVRAIEQGTPMVRAANNGISAVIDPLGRIVQRLPLNQRGVLDAALPKALEPTFYNRYGRWMLEMLLVLIVLTLVMMRRM